MDNNMTFLNACRNGQKSIVQIFLKKGGIDVNKRDAEGNTPLYYGCRRGLSPSTARYTSRREMSFASRERAGLAWPLTLVKSPAFLSDDIICLTKAGFVLTLSAMAWLVRLSFAFSAMKERMWTASLTFVEYFMGIAPLLYIKL